MAILFVIFLVLFVRLASMSFKRERSKKNKSRNNKEQASSNFFIEFFCCNHCKSSKSNIDGTKDSTTKSDSSSTRNYFGAIFRIFGSKNRAAYKQQNEIEIGVDGEKVQKNKSGLKLSELNLLDKMRYFGEKLERNIEDRFRRMGKFCAYYPKLVLFTGLVFCSLMCLGYFNFEIEKDPIKLWSSETSDARRNKKYFDENFGPFYRITQLIIEPKPSLIPKLYEDDNQNKFNITILQPDVLLQVYK